MGKELDHGDGGDPDGDAVMAADSSESSKNSSGSRYVPPGGERAAREAARQTRTSSAQVATSQPAKLPLSTRTSCHIATRTSYHIATSTETTTPPAGSTEHIATCSGKGGTNV